MSIKKVCENAFLKSILHLIENLYLLRFRLFKLLGKCYFLKIPTKLSSSSIFNAA